MHFHKIKEGLHSETAETTYWYKKVPFHSDLLKDCSGNFVVTIKHIPGKNKDISHDYANSIKQWSSTTETEMDPEEPGFMLTKQRWQGTCKKSAQRSCGCPVPKGAQGQLG